METALRAYVQHKDDCPLSTSYRWAHIHHFENHDGIEDWPGDTGDPKCGYWHCIAWAKVGSAGRPDCTCGLDALLSSADRSLRPNRFDCDECGTQGVGVDEDGCCRTCGSDARIVSSADRSPQAQEGKRKGPTCINCGDDNGGGYEIGREPDGYIAGPFCEFCFGEIEEFYRSPGSRSREEWQPIGTAPKGGDTSTRYVDLWAKTWLPAFDRFEYQRFPHCTWMTGDSMTNRPPYWLNLDKGWVPTHWMPEPPGPSVSAEQEPTTTKD